MARDKVAKVMGEFKRGTLKGPKKAPVVKSRKQAIAIALSQAGKSRPQKRAAGGAIKKFSPIARPQRFEGMK